MTIDIIAFSDMQYALLTSDQIELVKAAQSRKNSLTRACEARLKKEKNRLVKNGIFYSDRYALLEEEVRGECQQQIDIIREGLLFSLRYTIRPGENVTPPTSAPYTVDYALSYNDRLAVVKSYYETTYSVPVERFNAFKADTVAPYYLGEFYKGLYDYFLALTM